jgi:Aminotransferase class-V
MLPVDVLEECQADMLNWKVPPHRLLDLLQPARRPPRHRKPKPRSRAVTLSHHAPLHMPTVASRQRLQLARDVSLVLVLMRPPGKHGWCSGNQISAPAPHADHTPPSCRHPCLRVRDLCRQALSSCAAAFPQGSGMSVMEMSHRGKEFIGIAEAAEADLRELLNVPSGYKVLFLQGGASTQFAAVPLNLAAPGAAVDHVVTGSWSKKAVAEAEKYADAKVVAKVRSLLQPFIFAELAVSAKNGEAGWHDEVLAAAGSPRESRAQGDNSSIPPESEWSLREEAAYVHYCDNETIQGVEFQAPPDAKGKLLVGDFSSNFLSKPVDVSKFAVLYAGACAARPSGQRSRPPRPELLWRVRLWRATE